MNWVLLQNSMAVAGLATLLACLAGFVAALALSCLDQRWRTMILLTVTAPLILPPFLIVDCWLHYLGGNGVWRSWLPFDIYSLGGAVWILALTFWPISALMVAAAWSKIDRTQLDTEPALRSSALLRHLLWPAARPALALAGAIIFVLTLNNFAVPTILQVRVFPAELWIRFSTQLEEAKLWPIAWPLVVAPLIVLVFARSSVLTWPRVNGVISGRLFRRQLGTGWTVFVVSVTIGLGLLGAVLPLLQMLISPPTWMQLPQAALTGAGALWNSFSFAFLAATLGLIIALTIRSRHIGAALWLAFLVPGILLGLGLVHLLNRPGLQFVYQSAGVVVVALTVRYLALPWAAIRHAHATVDHELVDAARLQSKSSWEVWRHGYWPQIGPQIAAVWYVIYLLCLWDVETLLVLIPPGGETVALRVFNLLHYGHTSDVNALCLLLLLVGLGPYLLWQGGRMLWRKRVLVLMPLLGVLLGCTPASDDTFRSRFFSGVEIIGTRGTGAGQFNKPRSVALDQSDNLYVVDMTGRVQRFDPAGKYLGAWQLPQTDKGKPKGMICDQRGNVVVLEPHYSRVNHYSPSGELVAQWGQHGTNEGALAFPRALAVGPGGEIYVSEYGLAERVQCFDAFGRKWLWSIGEAGTGVSQFNRPEGLGIDSQGQLYVADSCNHRVQVFSRDGKALASFGRAGKGAGEFSYPYDVRVDRAGYQFVCEFGNSRVQVFSPDHTSLEIVGQPGTTPGSFNNPWAIALDSKGNLYVADANNHRVQKFIRRPATFAHRPVVTPAQQPSTR